MRVSKWGNGLAVRLPVAVVKALNLKEGDEVEIRVTGKRKFEVSHDTDREWALKTMRRLSRPVPPDFKFDREQLYERPWHKNLLTPLPPREGTSETKRKKISRKGTKHAKRNE